MIATVTAEITRDLLSLGALQINDQFNYRLVSFGGATVTWRREEATSPWMDGAVTVTRSRERPQEQVIVDVVGEDQSDLAIKTKDLITAFCQDFFYLNFVLDGQPYTWACEASDYMATMESQWMHNARRQVTFNVPRRPIPVAGPF